MTCAACVNHMPSLNTSCLVLCTDTESHEVTKVEQDLGEGSQSAITGKEI